MSVTQDVLDTLRNEIDNSKWVFGGKKMVNTYENDGSLIVELEDCSQICISVDNIPTANVMWDLICAAGDEAATSLQGGMNRLKEAFQELRREMYEGEELGNAVQMGLHFYEAEKQLNKCRKSLDLVARSLSGAIAFHNLRAKKE
jgi:hypothetical protein